MNGEFDFCSLKRQETGIDLQEEEKSVLTVIQNEWWIKMRDGDLYSEKYRH